MTLRLVFVAFILTCIAQTVQADCTTLDITAWSPQERTLLNHVAVTTLNSNVSTILLTNNSCLVCSSVSTVGLTSVGLRTAAQTVITQQATAKVNREALQATINNNQACNATEAQIESRINGLTDIPALKAFLILLTKCTLLNTGRLVQ